MKTPYDDIINLPHHVSATHKHMAMRPRAAQFAPFAALSGHDAAIAETARITLSRPELSDEQIQELSRRLAYALSQPGLPELSITFFRPDCRKSGGGYVTVLGSIKRIEADGRRHDRGEGSPDVLILTDGSRIPLDDVTDISGEIFDCFEF